MGALIKVAGFHGIEITITGTCGEMDSGENSGKGGSQIVENAG